MKLFSFARLCLSLAVLFAASKGIAAPQSDSCGLRISLLTCDPGAELYSTFGHSALRVVDNNTGTDIIYNYGTFEFGDPDFYAKFVRGKLLYYVNQESFPDFLYAYQMDQREVREQVLHLSCRQSVEIQAFLFNNIRDENKYYKYDFLFDNCTTRLRDIILPKNGNGISTANVIEYPHKTFRNHLHHYLNQNQMPWSKLGIDILLGSRLDRRMTNYEAMFLPDYLEKAIDSTKVTNTLLLSEKQTIFKSNQVGNLHTSGWFTPGLLGWAWLLLTVFLLLINNRYTLSILAITDFLLFFITGLLGVLLIFMWTATDHQICKDNYNLLWAIPMNMIAAFFIRTKNKVWKTYFLFVAVFLFLLLLFWKLLPQELNPALVPFIILISIRAFMISGMHKFMPWKNKPVSGTRP